MATDKRDRENDEESAGREEPTIGRYRNGGREESAGRDRSRGAGAGRGNGSGSNAERPPVGHRYGSRERPRPDRPQRRYGSRPPTGSAPVTESPVEGGSGGETGEPRQRSDRQRAPDEARAPPTGESEPRRADSERGGDSERDERRGDDREQSPESTPAVDAESTRRQADEPSVEKRADATPPKRTQPLREPSEPRDAAEQSRGGSGDAGERPPRYGGPHDEEAPSRPTDRERELREHERRMDRERDRQRDFQRDKSGNRYRRG
jgi:hypothetical protein